MAKKLVSLLLALMLLASSAPALAMMVFTDSAEAGDEPECASFAVLGDTAYVLDGAGTLYTRPLDGAAYTEWGKATNTQYMEKSLIDAAEGPAFDRLFALDGALCGVCLANGAWYTLMDSAGAYAPEKWPVALAFGLESAAGGSFAVTALFQQSGWLYLSGMDYAAGNAVKALRVNLETGKREDLKADNLYMLAPYQGDEVACYLYDPSTMTAAAAEGKQTVQFGLLNAASGEVTRRWDVVIEGLLGGYMVSGLCASDTTLYYKAASRVYGVDMQTGESRVSAYTGEGMLSGVSSSGLCAYVGGRFACVAQNALTLLPLDTDAVKAGALRIFGEFGSQTHNGFVKAHPEIPVDVAGDYTADIEKLTQAMLSETDPYDVLLLSLSYMPVERLIKKGYCTSLDGYPQIAEALQGMSERFAAVGVKDGVRYAVPVDMTASCMAVNAEKWAELGLTDDDLPTTYAQLFDFAANYMYDYGEDNPDLPLFTYGSADMLLYSLMLVDYMNYLAAKGESLRFDTPAFRELMRAFKAVDFAELGQSTDDTSRIAYSYMPEGLINIAQVVSQPSSLDGKWTPIPLSCDPDTPPVISATLNVLVINPKTKRMDEAVEYVSYYASHLNPTGANITLFPDHNEPVENEAMRKEIEQQQAAVAEKEALLAAASDENRASLQAELDTANANLAKLQEYLYTVSAEQIARFREQIEPKLYPTTQNTLLGGSSAAIGEVNGLLMQYASDAITLDALVTGIDSRIALMELEDQ